MGIDEIQEKQDDIVGNIVVDQDFCKELVRPTRTVALKSYSETFVLNTINERDTV